MAFDLTSLLGNAAGTFLNQGASGLANSIFSQVPGVQAPAPGATAGGLPRGIQDLIGGYYLQQGVQTPKNISWSDFASPASQASTDFLTKQFQSPTDPFAPGGIYEKYLPIIQRQEKSLSNQLQSQLQAGQPQSLTTAIGGPEIGAVQSQNERFLQNREALIAQLTQQNQGQQQQAAEYLLGANTVGQAAGFQAELENQRIQNEQSAQARRYGLDLLLGRQGTATGAPSIAGYPTDSGTSPGAGGFHGAGYANYPDLYKAIYGGNPPGGGGGGGGGVPGAPGMPGGAGGGGDLLAQAIQTANSGKGINDLMALLRSGQYARQPFPIALDPNTPAGQVLQAAISSNPPLAESPAAQTMTPEQSASWFGGAGGTGAGGAGASGAAGAGGIPGVSGLMSGQGFLGAPGLGSVSGIASGLGSGALGYSIGQAIGDSTFRGGGLAKAERFTPLGALAGTTGNKEIIAGVTGAQTGALAGFAVGGPVGAAIGAIAGGIGGVVGESKAMHAAKDASIAQETAQTNAQRPAALTTASDVYSTSQNFLTQMNTLDQGGKLTAAVEQLFAQGDPTVTAALQQAGKFLGTDYQGTPAKIIQGIIQYGQRGMIYDPALASNPESRMGLLQSKETGKFGPGQEFLRKTIQDVQTGTALMQQIVQRAQAAGLL